MSSCPSTLTTSDDQTLPFAMQRVTLTRQEHIELKCQAVYWKRQWLAASTQLKALREEVRQKNAATSAMTREIQCSREEVLLLKIKEQEAAIRDLTHRLYGNKNERRRKLRGNRSYLLEEDLKRPRGQQKGSRGHGRTVQPAISVVMEAIGLDEGACPRCKKPYVLLPDEESNVIEINVHAYTRRIQRQRGVKSCRCTSGSPILAASVPAKLLPKSPYGNSIWEEVLLSKFLYAQPINRILSDFKSLGLCISPGSIAGGLKNIAPLFLPLHQAFYAQQMTETRFHNDETRWQVYEQLEGKAGYRWYLWVTRSGSVIYHRMAKTRSATTPVAHFSGIRSKEVIIICDRYSAYKKLARLHGAIILAFCWVHVRRDFLVLVRSYPDLKEWGLDWVEEIGRLFSLNHERCALWDASLPLALQSTLFQEKQQGLKSALTAMRDRCDKVLEADRVAKEKKAKRRLTAAQRLVLESLQSHWEGLTVFYDYPDVPMDNNLAEQAIRHPVCGRKVYHGSGSVWSADLAAMMFSIFQTVSLCWQLNPRTWLRAYLKACADNGGRPPQDLRGFLPWTMSETHRQMFSQPPVANSS